MTAWTTRSAVFFGAAAASLIGLASLAGCGSDGATSANTLTVSGDIPLAYAQRSSKANMEQVLAGTFAPGGDLMIRDKSSASSAEHNMTAQITQGVGDVADPAVSYDGKKIVFAMNCPASNTSQVNGGPACTGSWNIWEYDMSAGGMLGGTFRRLTNAGSDDIGPAYLPGGHGFVFTSNRQAQSSLDQFDGHAYRASDEYEGQTTFNLHTMDADGGHITQISFNQSHDRNPVVRPNGDIMFSRWEHVGGANHFKIFTVKPDGTNMFVLYGEHSPGASFSHPQDMDPKGKHPGVVSTESEPIEGGGGGLLLIDAANYSEMNTPANAKIPAAGGQVEATTVALISDGLSLHGRITTPFPLWDGSDRFLVAFQPCEVMNNGVRVACATLPAEVIARITDGTRLAAAIAADTVSAKVSPAFSIYMFDPVPQTWLIVAAPPPGFMNVSPVALMPRTEPAVFAPTPVDATLAAQRLGILDIRSIYDTDGMGRMGDPVISAHDLSSAGCSTAIAKIAPTDGLDTRPMVADLAKIKDPADPAYHCAPGRFLRIERAIAPAYGVIGTGTSLGDTAFESQQIIGYVPIEPDGSVRVQVPADTPIAVQVVDAEGRAFQTHTNWIQVRPGERRTCDGCHSPRRGGALNSGAVAETMPTGLKVALSSAHQSGETMAETRTRLDPTLLSPKPDMVSTDVWADTAKAGVRARQAITLRYTGNPTATNDLATPVPTHGLIDYPDHIQPIWSRDRGANTCTNCHNDPTRLDLTATPSGDTGHFESYERLMIGDPLIDPATGLPQFFIFAGAPKIVRQPSLVANEAGGGDTAGGLARQSRLIEIMTGQSLKAGGSAAIYPDPPSTAPDHTKMLNAGELRVLAEFIDVGAKYYNNPFNPNSGIRLAGALSEETFAKQVLPILTKSCAAYCHQAVSSYPNTPQGTNWRQNRYVLTGDLRNDYPTTLAMISDTCNPARNLLLKRPSTIPHPSGATAQQTAVLPLGSADYTQIARWIATACTGS
jgi:hypothetical protein